MVVDPHFLYSLLTILSDSQQCLFHFIFSIIMVKVAMLISAFQGTIGENGCRTNILIFHYFAPIDQDDVVGKGRDLWNLSTVVGER